MPVRHQSAAIGLAQHDLNQLSLEELETLHQQGLDAYRKKEKQVGPLAWLEVKQAWAERLLHSCNFCWHHCEVNRLQGPAGYCQQSHQARLTGSYLHWGEERLIRPSWTLFFGGCTLHCRYCHNWRDTFSAQAGSEWNSLSIAETLSRAQSEYRSISFLGGTPEPQLHHIISLARALPLENQAPWVFNGNATLSSTGLALMEGLIDLWLPDFKHGNNQCAWQLTRVSHYVEMFHHNLKAYLGQHAHVLVRHLVIPGHLECCTHPVLKQLAGLPLWVNIMLHYRPFYQAETIAEINRPLNIHEKKQVQAWIKHYQLKSLDST